ncbi:Spc98 family-domain-containing protein [Polychytrium aggregatum]|uniref:Spc98 family-domain-containing protein n=1 Tax=Polychytrium aggregatum TaxID=110093 RepID=UPI0022FF423D|nr:Spc98 family-domain-containing protein [Polychytrium aggregatum]KAI9203724.1 Spc98 family-domain-containing protein [Polychytrium aggregatum]
MVLDRTALELLDQLVEHLTGHPPTTPEFQAARLKHTRTLKMHSFLSTNPNQIQRQLNGLRDKLKIRNRGDRTELLGQLTNRLVHPEKYDMLRLILELSRSPVDHQYEPSPLKEDEAQSQLLTWKHIIGEEPLVGAHWNTVPEAHDTLDSDDDDFAGWESDSAGDSYIPEYHDPPEQLEAEPQNNESSALVLDLVARQYWQTYKTIKEVEKEFSIKDATSLNPSLYRHEASHPRTSGLAAGSGCYVAELDVIRETLLMLAGLPTHAFIKDGNGSYRFSRKMSLTHLTDSALESLLAPFAQLGSDMDRLRLFNETIFQEAGSGLSRTAQAFASALSNYSAEFGETLAMLERKYRYTLKRTHRDEPPEVATLLDLTSELMPSIRRLGKLTHITNEVQRRCLSDEGYDRSVSVTILLDILHDGMVNSQSSNSPDEFELYTDLFLRSTGPLLDLIEAWIYEGSIHDLSNEFFIHEDTTVAQHSYRFWDGRYRLKETPLPKFLKPLREHIFSAGKALNVIRATHGAEIPPSNRPTQGSLHGRTVARISASVGCEDPSPQNLPDYPLSHPNAPTVARLHGFVACIPKRRSPYIISRTMFACLWEPFDDTLVSAMRAEIMPQYELASHLSTQLLFQSAKLRQHLECLQSVYLFMAGHVMQSFCHAVYQKILTRDLWFEPHIIGSLFHELVTCSDIVVDSSIMGASICNPDLCKTSPDALQHLAAISLHYEAPWPINNIITPEILDKYNLITGLLFQVKRTQFSLLTSEELSRGRGSPWTTDIQRKRVALRSQLHHFINTFHNYIMTTVINTESTKFLASISTFCDIQQIKTAHDEFVTTVRDRCLLNPKTLVILNQLKETMELCIAYTLLCHYYDNPLARPSPRESTEAEDREIDGPDRNPGNPWSTVKIAPATLERLRVQRKGPPGTFRAGGEITPSTAPVTQPRRAIPKSTGRGTAGAAIAMAQQSHRQNLERLEESVVREIEMRQLEFSQTLDNLHEEFRASMRFLIDAVGNLASHGLSHLEMLGTALKGV